MRQIKFRCWNKKDKKWMFGYEYPNLGGFSLTGEVMLLGEFMSEISLDMLVNDEIDITQFTGLHDKNGNEIYEGDVLKIAATAPWDEDIPLYPTGQVVFGDPFPSCFCFISEGSENTQCLYDLCGMTFNGEVIGNIHENPTLL